ncbi:MAG: DegT/DnrJ/EryC1/StrS family aminotransferase [candidate division Zixibacteria bacterium]|nr:DegT/DnrJ/EryC1/StrS family aminotransferase [candidate division Zixibacteria bacterium]
MKIPYIDLSAQYQSIKSEIDDAIADVINNSAFVLGPAVNDFEGGFATFCGVRYCVGVNSGTNALLLALKALDVGPGDEIITAANTFVATVAAIAHTGAKPVLVDVDPITRNIDSALLKLSLSQKTKVIIPVHLYGQIADTDAIGEVAARYGIDILEDAAQAQGATYKGQRAGSLGRMAAFSFYPAKNLGAFGEAGAVTTDDEKLAKSVRVLRDHGSQEKYHHEILGYNARMDGIQGAVLGVKLKHLNDWNVARRAVAGWYNELLADVRVTCPQSGPEYVNVFHVYVIETEERDALQAYLGEHQVPSIIHYPIPVHLQPAFDGLNYRKGDFPVSEKLADEILSLPIFPEMRREQVEFVCERIRDFFKGR